jgi:hypothetical protein
MTIISATIALFPGYLVAISTPMYVTRNAAFKAPLSIMIRAMGSRLLDFDWLEPISALVLASWRHILTAISTRGSKMHGKESRMGISTSGWIRGTYR